MDGKDLIQLQQLLTEALRLVSRQIVEHEGCFHDERIETTTMGSPDKRKFWCPQCGETIYEEFEEDYEDGMEL
jgi:hypothetical protein